MKKLITLCVFAFALLFSTQGLTAQNTKEINALASEKVTEMQKSIKLNKNQLEEIYQAYIEFETKYVQISEDLVKHQELLKKCNASLDEKLETILTPEQFKAYIAIYRSDK